MTEKTAKLMKENDVWLSPQVRFLVREVTPEDIEKVGQSTYRKWKTVKDGLAKSLRYAKKHEINIAFGTDFFASMPMIGQEFAARKLYFSDFEILKQATSINAKFLGLTGLLNPYPDAALGVIKNGAYADLI
ncbi:hypothetical protein L3081_22225 [Colwellia sp. MSW7]|uniref:Amidohydrolase-related domain-containing protein n=1 Tax=Colwellia maritima TaxID=2912588 RepID=A0ABS9X5T8_9GAMM|nr:hypothetical protein [Colwellia maritima]MCI2285603.1 hypothetical protein [Colwellia maritima]